MSVAIRSFEMSSAVIALMMILHLPSLLGEGSLTDEFSHGDTDTNTCHEYNGCLIPEISKPYKMLIVAVYSYCFLHTSICHSLLMLYM